MAAVVIIGGGALVIWLKSTAPAYSGEITITGLDQDVQVHFDENGVPHIEANNHLDLMRAFGYVHAQDRLFQMELLRRAGGGRLAEIIGQPMVKVDHLFRTIGIPQHAAASAASFELQQGDSLYAETQAYLDGINQFLHEGPTPPEFTLMGIDKQDFTINDLFLITGAMAFSFSQAQKTDPVIDFIQTNYGTPYLEDLGLWHGEESFIPNTSQRDRSALQAIGVGMSAIQEILPYAPLEGSNSWVVGPKKSSTGSVIFCNDTHIGYGLPQTWYEAHLKCNDWEVYGHFMAGIPFPLVGRTPHHSWGLTMLLNDDMDFYREEITSDGHHYLVDGQERALEERDEIIHVKGAEDTIIHVRGTHHGPMIERVFEATPQAPVSMLWSYTRELSQNIEALRTISHARDLSTFETGLSLIHGPGLNVTYGDVDGHIGWWACAHLLNRPAHVNSWTLLDGRDSGNDPVGTIPFDHNPRSIDPEIGYVYSANDWPGQMQSGDSSFYYPGYYKPPYRADRIRTLIEAQEKHTLRDMRRILNDITHDVDAQLFQSWLSIAQTAEKEGKLPAGATERLAGTSTWMGSYAQSETGPTCFNHILYFFLRNTMQDELGNARFKLFMQTHQVQRSYWILWNHANSKWYDNTATPAIETREQILIDAIRAATEQMESLFGSDAREWTWSRSATLELKHPLGEVALLRPFFNIGPEPMDGGNETIHQAGYKLDSTGFYHFFFGSQMRIIEDLAHIDSAWNVTPSGQSGHIMSPYFGNQAESYRVGDFRRMYRTDYPRNQLLILRAK